MQLKVLRVLPHLVEFVSTFQYADFLCSPRFCATLQVCSLRGNRPNGVRTEQQDRVPYRLHWSVSKLWCLHLVCVFVVLLVSRRWQKNPPERSKGTYELKKMILSWISAEGIHPLPAASSDDLESVQLCKSFI